MTKFAASLPDGDANGLQYIGHHMVSHPQDRHVIVAVVRTKRLTKDVDSGVTEATAIFERVEVVHPGSGDKDVAEQLMRRALERRHGQDMLPIELEDEITALFAKVADEWVQEAAAAEATEPAPADGPADPGNPDFSDGDDAGDDEEEQ